MLRGVSLQVISGVKLILGEVVWLVELVETTVEDADTALGDGSVGV